MKRGTKYVVRCHTAVSAEHVGLGYSRYRKGDLVTYDGSPARSIEKAHIYCDGDDENDFPWEEDSQLECYFEAVPVRVTVEVEYVTKVVPLK